MYALALSGVAAGLPTIYILICWLPWQQMDGLQSTTDLIHTYSLHRSPWQLMNYRPYGGVNLLLAKDRKFMIWPNYNSKTTAITPWILQFNNGVWSAKSYSKSILTDYYQLYGLHCFSWWPCAIKWRNICTHGDAHYITLWGRVTHICVGKLTIIGSDNGLSPRRHQAIIWTNVEILLIRPLGKKMSEILVEVHAFSLKIMH